MKTILSFFVAVIAVAGFSAFLTMKFTAPSQLLPADSHEWLHEQLKLTAAQHSALDPIEARYSEKQRLLMGQLQDANRELAQALGGSKTYSPKVAAVVEKIHRFQGELQKLSLEHLFEMRGVLTAEQGHTLLKLAQKALVESP